MAHQLKVQVTYTPPQCSSREPVTFVIRMRRLGLNGFERADTDCVNFIRFKVRQHIATTGQKPPRKIEYEELKVTELIPEQKSASSLPAEMASSE